MKSVIFLLAAALTTALVFLWACAHLADMGQVSNVQAPPLVGSGPYTAFAKHPSAGSSGPYYSVADIGKIRPGRTGTTISILPGVKGSVRTEVERPYLIDQTPPGLRHQRFRPLPSYQFAGPLARNHHGQIVGYCGFAGSGAYLVIRDCAFLWQRSRMHVLKTLPGYQITHAVALNDWGMIVGDATIDSFPGSMDNPGHAVCWIGRKVHDLGTGWAMAVNRAGDIVGDSGEGPADYYHDAHALLWTHGYRYDLNDCIPPRSGWLLSQAAHIDDQGRITGYGTFHGSARAFLLTPRRLTSIAPTRSCPPGRCATMVLTQHTPKRRHT